VLNPTITTIAEMSLEKVMHIPTDIDSANTSQTTPNYARGLTGNEK
jgi:hypothetical protein